MSHERPLRSVTGRDIPRERRCDLKVLAHTAAIIGLYLAFSFGYCQVEVSSSKRATR